MHSIHTLLIGLREYIDSVLTEYDLSDFGMSSILELLDSLNCIEFNDISDFELANKIIQVYKELLIKR